MDQDRNRMFEWLVKQLKTEQFRYCHYGVLPRDLSLFGERNEVMGRYLCSWQLFDNFQKDKNLFEGYAKQSAVQDPVWKMLPATTSPLVAGRYSRIQHVNTDAYWLQHNVTARIFIPVHSCFEPFWFRYFGLYYSGEPQELDPWLKAGGQDWLETLLNNVGLLLTGPDPTLGNPYLTQDILSEHCLKILFMTANGDQVKNIADKLCLTQEGVTYHISRAKKLFNARNKTHLIALLFQAGILR